MGSTAKARTKRQWGRCCSSKGAVKHSELLPGESDSGIKAEPMSANLYVAALGTPAQSDGGASSSSSPQLTRCPSSQSSAADSEPCEWHECAEDWGQQQEQQQQQEPGPSRDASMPSDLPAELAAIIAKYRRGQPMGCKPTLALMRFMQHSGTSLQQLRELLAPLLAGEAPDADLPTPAQADSPLSRTQSLMRTASSAHSPQADAPTAAAAAPGRQPSVGRLLGNVALLSRTLEVMASSEGFKQVSWGALQLWYKHDSVAQAQVIKAVAVLEEPVENLVCLTREVDLVTSWNPAIADCCELGSYSPAELLVYMLLWAPWPLASPEVVNYAVGVDMLDLEEGCVIIATNGVSELPAGVQLPQHARTMRLMMDAGGFKFRPLPPHPDRPGVPRTEATVLVAIDASKWAVPDAIISFVLKVFAPLVFRSVVKVLRRMFHSAASTAAASSGVAAAVPRELSASSSFGVSGEGDTALLARLAARPEYASIAARVQQHLAAQEQRSAEADPSLV